MAVHYSLRSTLHPSFFVHKAPITSLSNYSLGVEEIKYEQNNVNCQSVGKLSICNIMHSIDVKLCSLHRYCVLPGPFQSSYAVQGREKGRQTVILSVDIISITLTHGLFWYQSLSWCVRQRRKRLFYTIAINCQEHPELWRWFNGLYKGREHWRSNLRLVFIARWH